MDYNSNMTSDSRQRDLVLAPNEYCLVQSRTNGVIRVYTGPIMLTISAQEALVVFDEKTKQFKETNDFNRAKQIFTSAPEGWYVVLKNPAPNDEHPEIGKAVQSPALEVGKKVNIPGPCTFSLFPGQMAKVVQGHQLRSNQYLLARVYDAEAADKSQSVIVSADGKQIEDTNKYFAGQMLIIKGTDVSFYIPPTGIEVVPVDNNTKKGYVRNAVTLERLEYAILKDENGTKNYVHGPRVVFPKPTETFVESSKSNSVVFKTVELSPISGIYLKVIADYEDEKGIKHETGEEMFLTGNDQMIYHPRPEHAIISYDNKLMHHAIAIPEGEGRYIMNRLTGEISTVKGPAMYLPDPRTEVVVRRKLTPNQCELWYPGNQEVKEYNESLNEARVNKDLRQRAKTLSSLDLALNNYVDSNINAADTLAHYETNANISRGTSYTKPRTITLDNKFEGVVSIDVWTGYAVNVISKNGERKTICGPQTVLLDYDQTLEVIQMSTGNPKSSDHLLKTVYLRHENNKVSDTIWAETADFVEVKVKVSYCVDFAPDYKNKWFSIDNYVKYLCERERSLIKRAIKQYTIEEFYSNYADIVRDIAIDNGKEKGEGARPGRFFSENGMYVHDCEVLNVIIQSDIEDILTEHQYEMVQKSLELTDAEKRVSLAEALAAAEEKEQELRNQKLLNQMELERKEALRKMEIQSEVQRKAEAEKQAMKQAEQDMQPVLDAIAAAENARKEKEFAIQVEHKKQLVEIEEAKQKAYAETVAKIMESISEDLVAALGAKANADVLEAVSKSMSPLAIARGESVADTTNLLLRGTSLEGLLEQFANK